MAIAITLTPYEQDRCKIVYVDRQAIIAYLRCFEDRQFVALPKLEGLPSDARVENVWYSEGRRCFGLLLSSASFDIVPPGQEPPPFREFICFQVLMRKPMPYELPGPVGETAEANPANDPPATADPPKPVQFREFF